MKIKVFILSLILLLGFSFSSCGQNQDEIFHADFNPFKGGFIETSINPPNINLQMLNIDENGQITLLSNDYNTLWIFDQNSEEWQEKQWEYMGFNLEYVNNNAYEKLISQMKTPQIVPTYLIDIVTEASVLLCEQKLSIEDAINTVETRLNLYLLEK